MNIETNFLSIDDPRLVLCYRTPNCNGPSRISNTTVTAGYCCGSQSGVAIGSADGSCSMCNVTNEEIANATSHIQHSLTYATCLLWGRDHFRTFDGYTYDFLGS